MKDDTVAGQGLLQNQYLQASHALLTWIEASKSSVERLIDTMPFAFAILDTQGAMRRGNESLARLVGKDLEACLGVPFVGVFSSEDARAFEGAVARALSGPALNKAGHKEKRPEPVVVETTLRGVDGVERHYVWHVSRFDGAHPDAQGWISVFGNDITSLKTFQEKLARIFATLPIGVMQVDENYQVVDPVSSRTGFLLGQPKIIGRSLHELLFAPCWDSLSAREKESTGLLHASLGASEIQFDLVKDDLPRLVRHCREGNKEETYLGLTFQPIVRDGMVQGFLVLVEDRTELEALSRGMEKANRQEEIDATRYAECARLDTGLLRAVSGDLESALGGGTLFPNRTDALSVARVLHRLKGVGRFARLARLKDLCHALEEKVLATECTSDMCGVTDADLQEVASEVRAVLLLTRWLRQTKSDADASSATGPASQAALSDAFVTKLEALASTTAAASNKRVRLSCSPPTEKLPDRIFQALEEACVHIVTNAVDHGIECPEARIASRKPPEGRIEVTFIRTASTLEVRVADDGGGIDRERVLGKAIERGLLRQGQESAQGADWLYLLFEPQFSTLDVATETSGRGVGLSAAKQAVVGAGGQLRIETNPGEGTTFQMSFPMANDEP